MAAPGNWTCSKARFGLRLVLGLTLGHNGIDANRVATANPPVTGSADRLDHAGMPRPAAPSRHTPGL